jgi:hypothetical protein
MSKSDILLVENICLHFWPTFRESLMQPQLNWLLGRMKVNFPENDLLTKVVILRKLLPT